MGFVQNFLKRHIGLRHIFLAHVAAHGQHGFQSI